MRYAATAVNNSKYRSRLQIVADILFVAENGAKKTRIMYQANLSYDLLKRYLAEALEADLISINKDEKSYITTQKGKAFLKNITNIVSVVRGFKSSSKAPAKMRWC